MGAVYDAFDGLKWIGGSIEKAAKIRSRSDMVIKLAEVYIAAGSDKDAIKLLKNELGIML